MTIRFSSETQSYPEALQLIEALKEINVFSEITTGGVSIQCTSDQISSVKQVCRKHNATFKAGLSAHEEDVIARGGNSDYVRKINDKAIATKRNCE